MPSCLADPLVGFIRMLSDQGLVPHFSVLQASAATRRTLCAGVAVAAASTSRSLPAPPAATPLLALGAVSPLRITSAHASVYRLHEYLHIVVGFAFFAWE